MALLVNLWITHILDSFQQSVCLLCPTGGLMIEFLSNFMVVHVLETLVSNLVRTTHFLKDLIFVMMVSNRLIML